ncbi:hypothetical protein Tco_0422109 [Tanacetum coccineum]
MVRGFNDRCCGVSMNLSSRLRLGGIIRDWTKGIGSADPPSNFFGGCEGSTSIQVKDGFLCFDAPCCTGATSSTTVSTTSLTSGIPTQCPPLEDSPCSGALAREKIVTFEGTIDSEIMERKSVITRLNKVSSPDGDYLVIYRANGNFRAFNYLLEVLHIFDMQDLFHLYELVMKQYLKVTMEGIELILWGDLKIMMESSKEENDQSDFWNNQQNWKIVT